MKSLLYRIGRPPLLLPQTIQRQIFRYPHAPGLYVPHFPQLFTAVPDFNKHVLDNILGFFIIPQKPESKAIKLVFYREYKGLECFQIH